MEKETYWSKFADDYDAQSNYVVGESDMDIIQNEVSDLKNLKNVLELGCGNGIYSRLIAKESDELIATDFSDEMINAAKSRLKSVTNIKVENANCFNLPYPDDSFDTVFMANLLHNISEPEKAIAESKRVLKKVGRLIVIDLTIEGMTFFSKAGMIYRYLKTTYGKPSSKREGQNLTVKKIREMLESNGFKIEEAKLIGNKVKAVFISAIINIKKQE